MRVGVYVDGFNVYFGARGQCGRSTPGWRWLDLRALAVDLIGRRRDWQGAAVARVVYCTAFIDGSSNRDGRRDQDTYVRALTDGRVVDHVELGHYVSRAKTAPLATRDERGRPRVVNPAWPIMVQDGKGRHVSKAVFMASYLHREEKGSDVNLASHLLVDVLTQAVDAAVVLSNDSDLRYPIEQAREHVPVGLVNPSGSQLAGDLRGLPADGVGRHWWVQLKAQDYRTHQLPDPCAGVRRPQGW